MLQASLAVSLLCSKLPTNWTGVCSQHTTIIRPIWIMWTISYTASQHQPHLQTGPQSVEGQRQRKTNEAETMNRAHQLHSD